MKKDNHGACETRARRWFIVNCVLVVWFPAWQHFQTYRIRCFDCSNDFCASCKVAPYHKGMYAGLYVRVRVRYLCVICVFSFFINSRSPCLMTWLGGRVESRSHVLRVCSVPTRSLSLLRSQNWTCQSSRTSSFYLSFCECVGCVSSF